MILFLKKYIYTYCNLCSSTLTVSGIDGDETTNASTDGQRVLARVDNIVIGKGNAQLCQCNPLIIYSGLCKYLSLNNRYFNLIKIGKMGKLESPDELIATLAELDHLIEYHDPIEQSKLKFKELIYDMRPKLKKEEKKGKEEEDSDSDSPDPMTWDDTYVCSLPCVLVYGCPFSYFPFAV